MASKFPYSGSIKPRMYGAGGTMPATKMGPAWFSLRMVLKGTEQMYTKFQALDILFKNITQNCKPVVMARMPYSYFVATGFGKGAAQPALLPAIKQTWPKIAKEFGQHLRKFINRVIMTGTPMSAAALGSPDLAHTFAQVIADSANKRAIPIAQKRAPKMTKLHSESMIALAKRPTEQELKSYEVKQMAIRKWRLGK